MCAARYRCRQALRFAWKTIKSKVYDVLIVLEKEPECAKAVAAIAPAQHFLKKIFSFQYFSHTLYRLSVTLVIRKSRAFHKKIYASLEYESLESTLVFLWFSRGGVGRSSKTSFASVLLLLVPATTGVADSILLPFPLLRRALHELDLAR